MKPGMYEGLSNEQYHGSQGVSKSGLSLVAKCPSKYKYRYIEGNQPERTPAMLFGSALHTLVLEPEMFAEEYAIAPVINRRTKVGKADWAAFQELNKEKEILSVEDHEELMRIYDSVMSVPFVESILLDGIAESSLYHTDEETGKLVKVRPDWITEGVIVDIKTAIDGSPEGFSKACFNFGYHIQAAMYSEVTEKVTGRTIDDFVFIVVEKKEPYAVAVYRTSRDMLFKGHEEYRAALDLYSRCVDNNQWPGYTGPEKYLTIDLPAWAYR